MPLLRSLLRGLLPLLILAGFVAAGLTVIQSRPEPERRPPEPPVQTVEVLTLSRTDYPVIVRSQGTVAPRTESALVAEVAGRITAVAPAFRAGGFFETGDRLVQIDPRDFRTAVTVAEADLAQARLQLAEEAARADQAEEEWRRLELSGEPSPLTRRVPQLANARAAVASAESRLAQARRDLERTQVLAPYPGLLREQTAEIGEFVTRGTVLGRIDAVDVAEVRLPLTRRQQAFVDIPERYRGEPPPGPEVRPAVTLTAALGDGTQARWPARLVRAEGRIDPESRQLFVVARVEDPYARRGPDQPPLRAGQFVTASIEGRVLKDVFILPRRALRDADRVLIADPDARIDRRVVQPLWTDGEVAVVRDGLAAGERVILTPLAYASDGAPVAVRAPEEADPEPETIGGHGDA